MKKSFSTFLVVAFLIGSSCNNLNEPSSESELVAEFNASEARKTLASLEYNDAREAMSKLTFVNQMKIWENKLDYLVQMEGISEEKRVHLFRMLEVVRSLDLVNSDERITEMLNSVRGVFSDEELTLIGVAYNDLETAHFSGDPIVARNTAIKMVGFVAHPYVKASASKEVSSRNLGESINYCVCRGGFFCAETCNSETGCEKKLGGCGFFGAQYCIGECDGDPNPN